MNYQDWKKEKGVSAVKTAGDYIFFFERAGTDLGVLGVLFEGQLKKDPFCDRLGHSPYFTDICKAIYNSLVGSNEALRGMEDIQQILVGAALIYGRIPINKSGKASYDKSMGQGFHHLPFNFTYKSAFESGFSVGLLADDLIAVMDASRKDNLEWRAWIAKKRELEDSATLTQVNSTCVYPNKEDIDAAESQLRKTSSDEVIDVEAVLDQILINFEKAGKPLKEDWREATKQNIKIWFCNNSKS